MKHKQWGTTLGPTRAIWIAAVIDCEGTLTVHVPFNKTNGGRNLQVYGRVEMANYDVPFLLHNLCGGSMGQPKQKGNRKEHFYWNISSNGLRWLLPQIMKHLIVKKRHAEILLAILSGNPSGRTGSRYKMPYERLRKLITELRTINYKGKTADTTLIRKCVSYQLADTIQGRT
mgnify:FL=1